MKNLTLKLLPGKELDETTAYAPALENGYEIEVKNGDKSVKLTVNNDNTDCKTLYADTIDILAVNPKVAEKIDGDFDGMTVDVTVTKRAVNLTIDPALLMDSIDEVNILVDANVKILETVKKLVLKFVKAGVKQDVAASMALELHRRAAEKAGKLVPNTDEDDEKKTGEDKD